MSKIMLILIILIPILTGAVLPLIRFRKKGYMEVFLEAMIILNSILVWMVIINEPRENFVLANFTGNLSIFFEVDGLAMVFAGLVSFLWPFATLYAFEYMKHEKHQKVFFMFYTMTYGVTIGIAFAGNLLTMYFFYELLTLVTLPLVMHTLTREAILASRKYLYYSLGGAAFAFLGLIFIIIYGETTNFILGGVLDPSKIGSATNTLLLIYVIAFLGFGVKAAVFPFHSWLPTAGVAPTPVTALLHAVAVVKSGAFALIRLTYYSFGTEFLKGTWAQSFLMMIVMFTILYGCSRAVKETHFKRRLAYSTISNLSYILFGVVLMTPLGMVGALTHLVFHAFMKICSFFCAGAVMHQSGKYYVHELNGLGRKMPKIFLIFTVSALALMGVPGLTGFISKWNLAEAAVQSENSLAYVGIGCLLASALLTAIYMLGIVVRAYFPVKEAEALTVSASEEEAGKNITDPGWKMLLPLFVFAAVIIVFGLHSEPIVAFFNDVANGIFL